MSSTFSSAHLFNLPAAPNRQHFRVTSNTRKRKVNISSFGMSYQDCNEIDLKKNYVGIFVYDLGSYPCNERLDKYIHPGFIIVQDSNKITETKSKKRNLYSDLIKEIFGEELITMMQKYGASFGTFSVRKGKLKFNSSICTADNDDPSTHHGVFKEIRPKEQRVIKNCVDVWSAKPWYCDQFEKVAIHF